MSYAGSSRTKKKMISDAQKQEGMLLEKQRCNGNCFCSCSQEKRESTHEYLDKYPPFTPNK